MLDANNIDPLQQPNILHKSYDEQIINNKEYQTNNEYSTLVAGQTDNNKYINNTYQSFCDNKLFVDYDSNNGTFTFYKSKQPIGNFSALQIVKYVTSGICPNFLEHVNYEISIPAIKKYVCSIENNKINLLDYTNSQFMGDLSKVKTLYNNIENVRIDLDLNKLNDKMKKKILGILSNFSYLFLNYILKLIAHITNIIKNDTDKTELKTELLKYTVMITSKLITVLHDKIDAKTNDQNIILNDLAQMGTIKIGMCKSIAEIKSSVHKHNKQLNQILSKIDDSNGFSKSANITTSDKKSHSTNNHSSIQSRQSSVQHNHSSNHHSSVQSKQSSDSGSVTPSDIQIGGASFESSISVGNYYSDSKSNQSCTEVEDISDSEFA